MERILIPNLFPRTTSLYVSGYKEHIFIAPMCFLCLANFTVYESAN